VETPISLDRVADILEGAVVKRRAQGRDHGVALLSEGIADGLDPATLGSIERDSYGNIRLSELDLGRLLKERVNASLGARGLKTTIVAKDLGYELRCAPPGGYDIQYCRSLGYWATRFLLEGQTGAMVTIQGGRLIPVAFKDMLDPVTGRVRVRMVDVTAETYKTLYAYMIRLKPEDLADPVQLRALAKTANLSEAAFRERFTPVARTP
jgi:6-phosphofructokinase 1